MRNKRTTGKIKPAAVKSIARAGSILLALDRGMATITELADCCSLSKSTVHRLLKALEETMLVSQNPLNHRYSLGPLIGRFSFNPQNSHDYLITTSLDEINRLANLSEETVTISVMSGIRYIHLHEIPSQHDLKVTEASNARVRPLFMGASTRVLLAQLTEPELTIALRNLSFTPVTPKTITDMTTLGKDLDDIRAQGYSVSHGETVTGALCISAPIKGYVLPAAISIVGPENRFKEKYLAILPELLTATRHISASIARVFNSTE